MKPKNYLEFCRKIFILAPKNYFEFCSLKSLNFGAKCIFWQKYLNFGTFNFKAKNTILSIILLRQMTKKSPDGFGFFFFGFSMKVWRSQFFQPVICLPLNSKTKSGFSLLNRGREIWAIFFLLKKIFFFMAEQEGLSAHLFSNWKLLALNCTTETALRQQNWEQATRFIIFISVEQKNRQMGL